MTKTTIEAVVRAVAEKFDAQTAMAINAAINIAGEHTWTDEEVKKYGLLALQGMTNLWANEPTK